MGISYLSEGIPNGDKRYYGCQISHAWHLQDGVEVKFITLVEEKIEVVEKVGGISWEMGWIGDVLIAAALKILSMVYNL
ncbi:hypothetical protein [Pedobacter sp. N23S346]|uniref:hypothetical protein n=1 Tax=Pedobacter sp. N23S346 TaxID=3402750 RepID=UPI003AD03CBF